jgi:hypothetical protein
VCFAGRVVPFCFALAEVVVYDARHGTGSTSQIGESVMKRKFVYATVLIAGSAIAAACGGSDSSSGKTTPEGGTGKASGGSTGASAGGASSSGGKANGGGGNGGAGGLPFQLPEGGLFGPAEKVVPDPTCPGQPFMGGMMGAPPGADGGTTLPGCCDKSGVCGVSTAPFAGPFISLQCLTPADTQAVLARFPGGGGSFDAGPAKACTYK